MDAVRRPTPAPSPIDNEDDHTLSTGYSISDVLTKGVIPIVEESYEKIKRIGTGAELSDTIEMNRNNFTSFIDDKYIREVKLTDATAIYNWILNGDDENNNNYIGGAIDFNYNIRRGDITDEDVRRRIKNIVYTMLPFNAFCDYVENSARIFYILDSVRITFKLKLHSSRKFTDKETLEMDCTKIIEIDDNELNHSVGIKTGKNICITVSEPDSQEQLSTYVKASDSYVDGSRIVQFSPFPIILIPHNRYTRYENNLIERYRNGSEYDRDKQQFIPDLWKSLAIVSAEKDDRTGKYEICKISNNENVEIYRNFSLNIYTYGDKSIACGKYSLWLPKNIKPLKMYMQVNNSTPVELFMYNKSSGVRSNKKGYCKYYFEDTGRVEKLYIGEFKEYLLPDMHISSNGTSDNYVTMHDLWEEKYAGFNKINIYITDMNIDFIDHTDDNNYHGPAPEDHL